MFENYVISRKILYMKYVYVYFDNLVIIFNFFYFEIFIRYFKYICGFEIFLLLICNFLYYFLFLV